ncbi:CLUMA_CG015955, isoform A [Clunio marinus]|uniref:CLUMA_CG015955, isoform A n=1 Tax=Clunio marinus TaxID=568069 RepID=A0A1J1IW92_9DIPT|nr:CLUMA_CG015955, isoform A [Clunio marinus]
MFVSVMVVDWVRLQLVKCWSMRSFNEEQPHNLETNERYVTAAHTFRLLKYPQIIYVMMKKHEVLSEDPSFNFMVSFELFYEVVEDSGFNPSYLFTSFYVIV